MEDTIMEVVSFYIYVICICTFTEVIVRICIIGICTYMEAFIYDDAYTKGAYKKEIYGNPNASSIYAHLRNLSSVNAHLYVSFVYVLIHKRTYTKDVIMEVVGFCICVVCIYAFTKVAFVYEDLYIRGRAYTKDAHIWKTPLWKCSYWMPINFKGLQTFVFC